MAIRSTLREHRREERIHKECIDDKAKEHRTKRNREQVSSERTLAKSLTDHKHRSDTRCRSSHQKHKSSTRSNSLCHKRKCKRDGSRSARVHRHCQKQHANHAKNRVFTQCKEQFIRDKCRNQSTKHKSNHEPLAHIAHHVHKAIAERLFNLSREGP